MLYDFSLPFFYILDMLYFDQKGSGLCFSVDHTNQSLMPYFQKTKRIFLLQHLAAASWCSLRKSPIVYRREQLSLACCMTPVPGQPGHFRTPQELFAQQIARDFSGLLSPANRSAREGICSLRLLPSSTAQPAALHCHNTGWLLLLGISILFVSWDILISVRSS